MDLCPVDDHFSMNRWLPILAYEEDISILFCLEELISHKARNCESPEAIPPRYIDGGGDFLQKLVLG